MASTGCGRWWSRSQCCQRPWKSNRGGVRPTRRRRPRPAGPCERPRSRTAASRCRHIAVISSQRAGRLPDPQQRLVRGMSTCRSGGEADGELPCSRLYHLHRAPHGSPRLPPPCVRAHLLGGHRPLQRACSPGSCGHAVHATEQGDDSDRLLRVREARRFTCEDDVRAQGQLEAAARSTARARRKPPARRPARAC